MDTPYMLLYQRKSAGETKTEPFVMSEQLNKMVENDNISYMKEMETQNKKIDYGKVFSALAAQYKNTKRYDPEPRNDFDHDRPPDIF